jgi:phosphatidylinositol glycan class N
LIGIDFPVNSVGVLPIDFLAMSDEFKAAAAFTNAQQVLAQYQVKAEMKHRHEPFFVPFEPLENRSVVLLDIAAQMADGKYEQAEKESFELIQLCLSGLRYFQTCVLCWTV